MTLYAPRWLLTVWLSAIATALICFPAWPGYTSYDSMRAYAEASEGITSAIWPPMHAYMFAASEAMGLGLGGVFVVQTFALLLGAFLVINMVTARAAGAMALCLGFLATFLWIPPQMGVVMTQWRDVAMTSFALLALGAWVVSARRSSEVGVIVAMALFGAAVSLRHNSIALVGPAMLMMMAMPYLERAATSPTRIRIALAAILSLGVAVASSHWRLPDLRPISSGSIAVTTQQFDLIGISACASRSYLPAEMTGSAHITPVEARLLYDPRHINMSLGGPVAAALGRPSTEFQLRRVTPRDEEAETIAAVWRQAIVAEPSCYLQHRLTVFREQMGLAPDGVFIPVHGVMHPNPYGFELARPETSERVVSYVLERAASPFQRAIWLYVLAVVLSATAAILRPDSRPLLLSILAGALAYALSWFFVGPAADARYIFPANSLCALLIMVSVGTMLGGRSPVTGLARDGAPILNRPATMTRRTWAGGAGG